MYLQKENENAKSRLSYFAYYASFLGLVCWCRFQIGILLMFGICWCVFMNLFRSWVNGGCIGFRIFVFVESWGNHGKTMGES